MLGKLLLSSECLTLNSEFTLQTMDPRLVCILAESADQSEESTQLGHFQIKALDVRTEWGIPPPQGRSRSFHEGLQGCVGLGDSTGFLPRRGWCRHAAEIRLRLMENFCLNKVEVIMGSVTLAETDIYTGARQPAPLGSFVSSQPAFPGHLSRWFSKAGWRGQTS